MPLVSLRETRGVLQPKRFTKFLVRRSQINWIKGLAIPLLINLVVLRGAEPVRESPLGLSVENGTVMLQGKPFRGIGANYFTLFTRLSQSRDDGSSLSNLSALAAANIPFVRFSCGGYWPSEQRLYLENRELFLQQLDRVVQRAEQAHIGLVPSLFWHLPTVPDLVGEPMQELGNSQSKSIALIRRYTEDIVQRYNKSPAIWGWEFGNEPALGADLPNAQGHRPPIVPELGTPPIRTERDDLSSGHLHLAELAFAEAVRKFDRTRLIFSGNAMPRASAWHNTGEQSWKADSAAQFGEILQRDNPDPMNTLTVHLYASPGITYPAGARTIDEIIAATMQEARRAGKPLFIGEFGAERQLGTLNQQKVVFQELLTAIDRNEVPLAAFWVFDLSAQEKTWNISFQNDRSFLIRLVAEANARLRPKKP
jgi:hypothetical protein